MAFKQTKCFKWLDNFWYHYKVHTLVGLFLAFVVIFSAVQLLTIQSYDYYVILYSTDTTSTDSVRSPKRMAITTRWSNTAKIWTATAK